MLVHRSTVAADPDAGPASAFEAFFRGHDRLNNWRYPGIHDYYHVYSTSHEVLGFARRRAHVAANGYAFTPVPAGSRN